jgi:hypothetical protein
MTTFILTQLPRKVAEATGAPAPNPRKLYNMTVGAKWPAEQINGRWHIAEADLPMVVEALGLTMLPAVKQAVSRKTTPKIPPATQAKPRRARTGEAV